MLDLKLEGKRALVTGSSSGIGEAIVRTLAAQGAAVVVHGRNAERARHVADSIAQPPGDRAPPVVLGDLGRDDEARRVVERTVEALGGVDILVNNAGVSAGRMPWLETPVDKWRDLFEQDVLSAVRMIDALVPPMRTAGWGRVIQIASVAGTQPMPTGAPYSAAKAAMLNMTVSLAKDLAGSGVTVNTVSPGPIATPMADRLIREVPERQTAGEATAEEVRKAQQAVLPTLVGRFGEPGEVAALVAFLASPLADFITGADLRIDGGRVGSIN